LWRVFWDRGLWTMCPGWLQTSILLISASWVARLTGVSHQCPVWEITFKEMHHLNSLGIGYQADVWSFPSDSRLSKGRRTGIWTQGFALAKRVLYCLNFTSNPLCSDCFGDEVLRTMCLGWPQTLILMISAFQVAR
jgi:hypothetical protein